MAKLAANLVRLRSEIDRRWPKRDKKTDGWIASPTHPRPTDHAPDARGIVHAIDVDADGIDTRLVVRQAIKHPTTEYVIHDRTIWSRVRDFKPRAYTGANPHESHIHISGRHGASFEGNTKGWGIAVAHKPGSRTLVLADPFMEGEDVVFVQKHIGAAQAGEADGVFGPRTRDGVAWYQKKHDLDASGKVGRRTWESMGVTWTGG